MCPTVFVVLPSLKVGSRDGTSFSIVCTMCPKTSGPRGTAAVCCGANARHRPPVCTLKLGGRGFGSFLRTLVLGRLLHNFQL